MVVHQCDLCGKVMTAWVSVKMKEDFVGTYFFDGSLDRIANTDTEICFECFKDKMLPILGKNNI